MPSKERRLRAEAKARGEVVPKKEKPLTLVVRMIIDIPGLTENDLEMARYHLRKRQGKCTIGRCTDPPVSPHIRCERHLAMLNENLKRYADSHS